MQGWPEIEGLLHAINGPGTPFESVGCEKAYFQIESGPASVSLGVYIDIVRCNRPSNTPAAHLAFAARMGRVLRGAQEWWGSTEIALQRLRHLDGVEQPWGTMLRLTNYGRDRDEARRFWGHSADLLTRFFESYDDNERHA